MVECAINEIGLEGRHVVRDQPHAVLEGICSRILTELQRVSVTLPLLWEEYRELNPNGNSHFITN
jgi:hypothetical protein